MTELPHEKVLKDTIVKLKAKAIESQKIYLTFSSITNTTMIDQLNKVSELANKTENSTAATIVLTIITMLQMWNQNFTLLTTNINALIKDTNLYIETLEKYSTELDSTLTNIFEMARKQAEKNAEEQRKQQEDANKKTQPYRS